MIVGDVVASEWRSPASASAWEYIAPSAMMVTAARTPKAVTAKSPHAERSRRGSSHSRSAKFCNNLNSVPAAGGHGTRRLRFRYPQNSVKEKQRPVVPERSKPNEAYHNANESAVPAPEIVIVQTRGDRQEPKPSYRRKSEMRLRRAGIQVACRQTSVSKARIFWVPAQSLPRT